MTTTLKQQVEQWINQEAMKHDDNTTFTNGGSYITGAHSILPMLVVAVEALKCNETFHRLGGIDDCEPCSAIYDIKQMIEGDDE